MLYFWLLLAAANVLLAIINADTWLLSMANVLMIAYCLYEASEEMRRYND